MDRSGIVNWVHQHIPYFQAQFGVFCRLAEQCGEHVTRCLNDPALKVHWLGKEERGELDAEQHRLLVQAGEIRREFNTCKDAETQKELDAEQKKIEQRLAEIVEADKPKPPAPGCVRFSDRNYQCLDVPRKEVHWVTSGAVNPLLWFGFFGDSGIQRKPSEEERLLAECVVLAVAHDWGNEIRRSEEHIYLDDKYTGKYFQRDRFCRALYSKLDDGLIERAYESVRAKLKQSMEQPWADDASEYLPLTEARKLIDNRWSLSALSKWLTPDGEIRYMRKKGVGCKVHVADFRWYMQSRQSDPTFAKALAAYYIAAGKGDVRFFWQCPQCRAAYPENAGATANCPKCKTECKLIRKAPPTPRR